MVFREEVVAKFQNIVKTIFIDSNTFKGNFIGNTSSDVTPCPERVYGMCNRMCTKGFLNSFSVIIEFLKVVLRVKL